MTPDMVEMLKRHEGYRKHIYKDTEGIITIGYGTNLADGLEKFEAEALLLAYVLFLERELPQYIKGWYLLSTARKDVLINMAYNLGVPKFLKFKKMLEAIAASDYARAATEMLDSKWAIQVGERAHELAAIMRGYSVRKETRL